MKNKSNLSFLIVVVSMCLTLALSAFAQDSSSDSLDGQSPQAPAASLFVDNFTYSGALTANGWSTHSGTTNPLTTTTGLTYSGYTSSGVGNAVLVGNGGGEDDNMPLSTAQNTNGAVVYFSCLINVNDAATDKTGDYFMHIGTRTSPTNFTLFASRVFARIVAGNVNFGLSNTSTPAYGTTNFSKNRTYLLIVKYTINTGGADTTQLWVIPSGVPASEAAAGTPEVTDTATTGQDVIDAIALRQGSSSTSTQEVVDGIRVGTTWADITGATVATTAPHIFTTVLNGANEVPANSSTATGFGRVVLNAAETQITASVYWNNIGPGATSAHIHGPAAVGVNGSILFNMQPTTATSGSSVDQVFTVTATDVANLRAGLLYFNVHSGTNFSGGEIRGQLGPIPAKSDFDGDGKTDYGVVRSGSGSNPNQLAWYIKLNGGGDLRRDWGLNTDIVTPADYDGDGKEDIAVWRQSPAPSYFYVLRSSDSTFTITAFGVSGDIPISRDYTGDGKADLAVYRSTDSTFWYNPSSGPFLGHPVEVPFGVPGDFPDPGDFNGDGKADFCVFHNTNNGTGTFNIRYGTDSVAAGSPDTTTYFGRFTTDSIISGDFDGDGKADIAVTRPESGKIIWYYLPSTGGGYQRLGWGVTGDLQVPGDYDGDGKTDFAIWRPSQTSGATAFYVLGSTSGFLFQPWGLSSDTPVNFDVLQ